MNSNVNLELKLVGDIKGKFFVPAYQRGYRWEKTQVKTLLNDLWSNAVSGEQKSYCLQPVVVRSKEDGIYELIDGQQRLTTILILIQYFKQKNLPFNSNFEFEYETRKETSKFFNNINKEDAEKNIDFFHVYRASMAIDEWLNEKFPDDNNRQFTAMFSLYRYLSDQVKVIWYEVDKDMDPVGLFTRLNIGKISLTNAELVRALFLKGVNDSDEYHTHEEISYQWDIIEKQLRDNRDEFWAFMTTESTEAYPTRIEILFDLIAGKKSAERDMYFTFFEFEKRIAASCIKEEWKNVYNKFLQIKDWYSNNELYHKIGYLIASGSKTMADIFEESDGLKKHDFVNRLNTLIAESIDFNIKSEDDYWDIDYENHYDKISKLLLLFNVQSILNENVYQRFPFSKYNNAEWSLEHIHAQNSEGLKTWASQKEWIEKHLESLKDIYKEHECDDLIAELEEAKKENVDNNGKAFHITRTQFEELAKKVIIKLSADGNQSSKHSLSNMALLTRNDNSALNNSTFDVKRNDIIEMDKKGSFIPYCTKMVFLKYYTKSADNQVHFWGEKDREAYLNAIKTTLSPYVNLLNFEG